MIQQFQSELGTYSRALDGTTVDVIDDVVGVSPINAAAHGLGSAKDLLDGPCSRETEPVSAEPRETPEELTWGSLGHWELSLLMARGGTE